MTRFGYWNIRINESVLLPMTYIQYPFPKYGPISKRQYVYSVWLWKTDCRLRRGWGNPPIRCYIHVLNTWLGKGMTPVWTCRGLQLGVDSSPSHLPWDALEGFGGVAAVVTCLPTPPPPHPRTPVSFAMTFIDVGTMAHNSGSLLPLSPPAPLYLSSLPLYPSHTHTLCSSMHNGMKSQYLWEECVKSW